MFDDEKALEVDPHRVWGVGESPVRKGIASQQIAEFIVYSGHGEAKNWEQSQPQEKRKQADKRYRQPFFARQRKGKGS